MPVLVAPMAMHGLAHPDKEPATARAAAAAGIPMVGLGSCLRCDALCRSGSRHPLVSWGLPTMRCEVPRRQQGFPWRVEAAGGKALGLCNSGYLRCGAQTRQTHTGTQKPHPTHSVCQLWLPPALLTWRQRCTPSCCSSCEPRGCCDIVGSCDIFGSLSVLAAVSVLAAAAATVGDYSPQSK